MASQARSSLVLAFGSCWTGKHHDPREANRMAWFPCRVTAKNPQGTGLPFAGVLFLGRRAPYGCFSFFAARMPVAAVSFSHM